MIIIKPKESFEDFEAGHLIMFTTKDKAHKPRIGLIRRKYPKETVEIITQINTKGIDKTEYRGSKTIKEIRYLADFSFLFKNDKASLDNKAKELLSNFIKT